MKKLIAVLIFIAFAFAPRKEYKFTDGQAVMMYNYIQATKQIIPSSDQITAKQGNELFIMADSLQKIIVNQYRDTLK